MSMCSLLVPLASYTKLLYQVVFPPGSSSNHHQISILAAGSAVSAILGIQATKEAEAQAAHEERLRAEAEARAAEVC